MKTDKVARFRSKEARALMALTLAMDPTMAGQLRHLFRMGAYDIRPDYMYVFNRYTGKYDRMDDPGAWNATLFAHVGVSLLRGQDGVWFLNGY